MAEPAIPGIAPPPGIASTASPQLRRQLFALIIAGCFAGTLALLLPHYALLFELLLAFSLAAVLTLSWREIERLRATARIHELAMQGAHDGVWSWNPVTKELLVGPRLLSILGYAENFLPNTDAWLKLVHRDDVAHYNSTVAAHLKGLSAHFYCEYRVRARSGEYRWIASRGIALRDRRGIATLMVGSVSDITERRRNEEQIQFLAFHDQLTGLPNRRQLAERLPQALAEAQQHGHRVAVLFIDLDRFKNINDTLGHNVGDQLLQSVALRLQQCLAATDTIVRQGGDEFIVVLPSVRASEQATQAAEQVLAALATPFREQGYDFLISASIGIAFFPEDGRDGPTLLRNADTAMYEVKSAGGGAVRCHTGLMNERVPLRVSLENRLQHALERGELSLHYQPQVEVASGRMVGAEALLRWKTDEGFISPERFIPVAEETGLILPIGAWVLETAIAQAAAWRQEYGWAPRIAVNLSPRQFWRRGMAESILAQLAAVGLPNDAIELEITESMLLRPEGDSIEELRILHGAGLRLALDDFGTGYSSLSYLRLLPIDVLKVDRAFIAALTDDSDESSDNESDSLAIVRAVLAMAHTLGFDVVAEGVETSAQLVRLRDLDCGYYQGYLFSRPLAAEDFAARLLATAVRHPTRA